MPRQVEVCSVLEKPLVFCTDVSNPEGPISLADGSWLITEMGRGLISRISTDGRTRRAIARTGRPNGLALDGDGNLWVAESRHPALLRVTMGGEVTEVSRGPRDLPFLWPNDLCFGPDGALYLTDSGVPLRAFEGIQPPEAAYDLPIDGRVFRVDPRNGDCRLLDRGLRFANGIAFGPGGEDLFVAETLTGTIHRYRIVAGQVQGAREAFANVLLRAPREHRRVAGPDGMAFDVEGNLYVAVLTQGDVTVLRPDGSVSARLDTGGTFPTNVAFARPGERRLLVTEGSQSRLLLFETPADGLPLYRSHATIVQ